MRRFILGIALFFVAGVGTATAAPPQNTSLPTIKGTAQEGETLTADPGTWTGQPAGFTYQWLRCDTGGASCSAIIGSDSKTRVVTSADVGDTLRVRVRATNSDGSNAATSTATVVVKAKPSPPPPPPPPAPTPVDVSLDANRSLVVYGNRVFLSGTVSSGRAGETVTIMENRYPFGRTSQARTLTTVTSAAGGEFTLSVRPRIQTLYSARVGNQQSQIVSVNVQPRLRLTRVALPFRFQFRVSAMRSFAGRFGLLQRWNSRAHVWVSMRRVRLTSATFVSPTTVVSRAAFRVRNRGLRIRVFMPRSQTAPGYVSGFTNVVRI